MASRTKNSARNIIWVLFEKMVMVLFPFALKTIMLRELGADYLGINSLFTSILSVLNIAELGFSSAIVFCMYKPLAEEDTDAICALMNFYKKVYRIIGCVIAGGGVLLIPFLDYLVDGDYPAELNVVLLYVLFLLNDVLGFFMYAYKSCILSATQRTDVLSKVNIVLKIGMYILQAVVLIVSHNYYLFIGLIVFNTIITNVISAYYSTKLYPEYVCRGEIREEDKKIIKKNIKGLLIGNMAMISRNSFDSIFVSMFLGLRMVAIYSNYYYIMNAVISIVLVVSTSIKASIGNSIAIETKEKNHRNMLKFTFIYSWICGWFGICLVCLYQPFMTIWMGKDMLLPVIDVFFFGFYFYSLTMGDIKSVYNSGAGLFWESRYYVFAEAIANIALNYVLGKMFGVGGIIIATTISILLINVGWGSVVLYKYYFTEYKVHTFLMKHLVYFLVFFTTLLMTFGLTSLISGGCWIELFGKGVICVLFPNVAFWLVYHRSESYLEGVEFMKYVLKTVK